jgi:hypothetical protein
VPKDSKLAENTPKKTAIPECIIAGKKDTRDLIVPAPEKE